MTKFIRMYQNLGVNQIKDNLLIYGEISGSCAKCQAIDVKLDHVKCPQCQTPFNYIAFRNVKSHIAKWQRLLEARPYLKFVDYEDFHRNLAEFKAKEIFK